MLQAQAARLCGSRQVHIVDADTSTANDAQAALGRLKDRPRHLGSRLP